MSCCDELNLINIIYSIYYLLTYSLCTFNSCINSNLHNNFVTLLFVMDGCRNQQQTEGMMAPTTTIETITITRPLKVIAFICGIIVVVLMLMALTSTDWLLSSGWRQGLFVHCISDDAELPLPFNLDQQLGQCFDSRDKCKL